MLVEEKELRSNHSLLRLAMKKGRAPTNAQISSKLGYSAHTPSFLVKLQNKVAGIENSPSPEPEDDGYYDDGSGRPPIPVRRPDIPQRPDGDEGSVEEDEGDERPTVVVLKEGKHLSAREAENERRKGSFHF